MRYEVFFQPVLVYLPDYNKKMYLKSCETIPLGFIGKHDVLLHFFWIVPKLYLHESNVYMNRKNLLGFIKLASNFSEGASQPLNPIITVISPQML